MRVISSRSSTALKGRCHGDFGVCWPKQLKYLTKNLVFKREITLRVLGGKYEMISPRKNKL